MDNNRIYSLRSKTKVDNMLNTVKTPKIFLSPETLKQFPDQTRQERGSLNAIRISNLTKKNTWSRLKLKITESEKPRSILQSEIKDFNEEEFELFSPSKLDTDFAMSSNIYKKTNDKEDEELFISHFTDNKETYIGIKTNRNIQLKSRPFYIIKGIETISSLSSQVDYEQSNSLLSYLNKMLRQNSKFETSCTCTKSHCLKEYCQCYKKGVGCNASCKCVQCLNECKRVIDRTTKKVRCNCSHTGCIKKYCECYRMKMKCKNCSCKNCQNV